MAHQQFSTKAEMQKAENNAEYIPLLLSLPLSLRIAARAILQTQTRLLWVHT